MSSEIVVHVQNLSKNYNIFDSPRHRLRQFIMPRLRHYLRLPVKHYFRQHEAIKNVTFDVKKGETVGIIGRNGSGKSTLLQLICGTLTPTAGEVKVNGRVAALLELGSGFNPDFTGRDNVFLNSALLGLTREETEERFDGIAAFADIGQFIDQPVRTYSSGMVVRLAFAVTINVDPDILVIDEALSVGDTAFQFKCLKRMESLQEQGVTLLFVSHDMGMVQSFCQKAVYLEAGEIKTIGNPEGIAAQYFFDNRELHRQALGLQNEIVQQNPLGAFTPSAAFGNRQGTIAKALFTDTQAPSIQLPLGEPLDIDIEIHLTEMTQRLALAMVVQTPKLVEITGKRFILEDACQRVRTLRVRVDNKFACGDYFVTLRLLQHIAMQDYMPLQSQIAALHFQVNDNINKQKFLGHMASDISLEETTKDNFHIVAILAVRNESMYMERCLKHLAQQEIDAYIIDNQSDDETITIAEKWQDRCVIGIESYPYQGFYDWRGLLERKAQVANSLNAAWFIHHDADEIRESRDAHETLKEAIMRLDAQGFNAIEFDEFVFLPRNPDEEPEEPGDYVERLTHGYHFAPTPQHRINAWKKTAHPVDLVTYAGHQVAFSGLKLAPEKLILRHYPCLSAAHLYQKYGEERVYSDYEVNQLQWHGKRAEFRSDDCWWPQTDQLFDPRVQGWDTSNPWTEHPFLGGGQE